MPTRDMPFTGDVTTPGRGRTDFTQEPGRTGRPDDEPMCALQPTDACQDPTIVSMAARLCARYLPGDRSLCNRTDPCMCAERFFTCVQHHVEVRRGPTCSLRTLMSTMMSNAGWWQSSLRLFYECQSRVMATQGPTEDCPRGDEEGVFSLTLYGYCRPALQALSALPPGQSRCRVLQELLGCLTLSLQYQSYRCSMDDVLRVSRRQDTRVAQALGLEQMDGCPLDNMVEQGGPNPGGACMDPRVLSFYLEFSCTPLPLYGSNNCSAVWSATECLGGILRKLGSPCSTSDLAMTLAHIPQANYLGPLQSCLESGPRPTPSSSPSPSPSPSGACRYILPEVVQACQTNVDALLRANNSALCGRVDDLITCVQYKLYERKEGCSWGQVRQALMEASQSLPSNVRSRLASACSGPDPTPTPTEACPSPEALYLWVERENACREPLSKLSVTPPGQLCDVVEDLFLCLSVSVRQYHPRCTPDLLLRAVTANMTLTSRILRADPSNCSDIKYANTAPDAVCRDLMVHAYVTKYMCPWERDATTPANVTSDCSGFLGRLTCTDRGLQSLGLTNCSSMDTIDVLRKSPDSTPQSLQKCLAEYQDSLSDECFSPLLPGFFNMSRCLSLLYRGNSMDCSLYEMTLRCMKEENAAQGRRCSVPRLHQVVRRYLRLAEQMASSLQHADLDRCSEYVNRTDWERRAPLCRDGDTLVRATLALPHVQVFRGELQNRTSSGLTSSDFFSTCLEFLPYLERSASYLLEFVGERCPYYNVTSALVRHAGDIRNVIPEVDLSQCAGTGEETLNVCPPLLSPSGSAALNCLRLFTFTQGSKQESEVCRIYAEAARCLVSKAGVLGLDCSHTPLVSTALRYLQRYHNVTVPDTCHGAIAGLMQDPFICKNPSALAIVTQNSPCAAYLNVSTSALELCRRVLPGVGGCVQEQLSGSGIYCSQTALTYSAIQPGSPFANCSQDPEGPGQGGATAAPTVPSLSQCSAQVVRPVLAYYCLPSVQRSSSRTSEQRCRRVHDVASCGVIASYYRGYACSLQDVLAALDGEDVLTNLSTSRQEWDQCSKDVREPDLTGRVSPCADPETLYFYLRHNCNLGHLNTSNVCTAPFAALACMEHVTGRLGFRCQRQTLVKTLASVPLMAYIGPLVSCVEEAMNSTTQPPPEERDCYNLTSNDVNMCLQEIMAVSSSSSADLCSLVREAVTCVQTQMNSRNRRSPCLYEETARALASDRRLLPEALRLKLAHSCPSDNTTRLCEEPRLPCQNGGSCLQRGSRRYCVCPQEYTGSLCEQPLPVNFLLRLRLTELQWVEALADPSSPEFASLSQQLSRSVESLYRNTPGQQSASVLAFRPGSVVADMGIQSSGFSQSDQLQSVVLSAIKNGSVGGYRVSPQDSFFTPLSGEASRNESQICPDARIRECQNGGTCFMVGFKATCLCSYGYSGPSCETYVGSACDRSPCQNGFSCQPLRNGSYSCGCPSFMGPHCEQARSFSCRPEDCKNGGSCLQYAGLSFCACPSDDMGPYCAGTIDEISTTPTAPPRICPDTSGLLEIGSNSCSDPLRRLMETSGDAQCRSLEDLMFCVMAESMHRYPRCSLSELRDLALRSQDLLQSALRVNITYCVEQRNFTLFASSPSQVCQQPQWVGYLLRHTCSKAITPQINASLHSCSGLNQLTQCASAVSATKLGVNCYSAAYHFPKFPELFPPSRQQCLDELAEFGANPCFLPDDQYFNDVNRCFEWLRPTTYLSPATDCSLYGETLRCLRRYAGPRARTCPQSDLHLAAQNYLDLRFAFHGHDLADGKNCLDYINKTDVATLPEVCVQPSTVVRATLSSCLFLLPNASLPESSAYGTTCLYVLPVLGSCGREALAGRGTNCTLDEVEDSLVEGRELLASLKSSVNLSLCLGEDGKKREMCRDLTSFPGSTAMRCLSLLSSLTPTSTPDVSCRLYGESLRCAYQVTRILGSNCSASTLDSSLTNVLRAYVQEDYFSQCRASDSMEQLLSRPGICRDPELLAVVVSTNCSTYSSMAGNSSDCRVLPAVSECVHKALQTAGIFCSPQELQSSLMKVGSYLPSMDYSNCTQAADGCGRLSCQNGGECIELPYSARCMCPLGYIGSQCEEATPTRAPEKGACPTPDEMQVALNFCTPALLRLRRTAQPEARCRLANEAAGCAALALHYTRIRCPQDQVLEAFNVSTSLDWLQPQDWQQCQVTLPERVAGSPGDVCTDPLAVSFYFKHGCQGKAEIPIWDSCRTIWTSVECLQRTMASVGLRCNQTSLVKGLAGTPLITYLGPLDTCLDTAPTETPKENSTRPATTAPPSASPSPSPSCDVYDFHVALCNESVQATAAAQNLTERCRGAIEIVMCVQKIANNMSYPGLCSRRQVMDILTKDKSSWPESLRDFDPNLCPDLESPPVCQDETVLGMFMDRCQPRASSCNQSEVVAGCVWEMLTERSYRCNMSDIRKAVSARLPDKAANCTRGDVALTRLGRVLLHDGRGWTSVCGREWSNTEAGVVCRRLGLGKLGSSGQTYMYGQLAFFQSLAKVSCQGNETAPDQCSWSKANSTFLCDSHAAVRSCFDQESTVTLKGGDKRQWGWLSVTRGNQSGLLCLQQWDNTNAALACKQLGFKSGSVAQFSQRQARNLSLPSRAQWSVQLNCWGIEGGLDYCSSDGWRLTSLNNTNNITACQPVRCHQDITLSNAFPARSGRVIVAKGNETVSICADNFSDEAADVICRQSGFPGGEALNSAFYINDVTHRIALLNVSCPGGAASFSECQSAPNMSAPCPSKRPAAVLCDSPGFPEEADWSVTNQGGWTTGVYRHGQVGRFCADGFDEKAVHAFCRQVGNDTGVASLAFGSFRDSAPHWVARVTCPEGADSLKNCSLEENTGSQPCKGTAYATCFDYANVAKLSLLGNETRVLSNETRVPSNDTRVPNNDTKGETTTVRVGGVSVTRQGVTAPLCISWPEAWTDELSAVACRQMGFKGGYSAGAAKVSSVANSTQGWHLSAACQGEERLLLLCYYLSWDLAPPPQGGGYPLCTAFPRVACYEEEEQKSKE